MLIFKKPLGVFSGITIALVLIGGVLLYINWGQLPEKLILQLGATEGAKEFGTKANFLSMLATGVAILLINFTLANTLFYRERFLAVMLVTFNTFFALITLIITALVITIN
jgi:hypothetical protein